MKKNEIERKSVRVYVQYLTRIEVRWRRIAVILWRGRESSALKDGRVTQLPRFRHVNINVHSRAILVRIIVTRSRLWCRRRSVVSPPIEIVTQLFITTPTTTNPKQKEQKTMNQIIKYVSRNSKTKQLWGIFCLFSYFYLTIKSLHFIR